MDVHSRTPVVACPLSPQCHDRHAPLFHCCGQRNSTSTLTITTARDSGTIQFMPPPALYFTARSTVPEPHHLTMLQESGKCTSHPSQHEWPTVMEGDQNTLGTKVTNWCAVCLPKSKTAANANLLHFCLPPKTVYKQRPTIGSLQICQRVHKYMPCLERTEGNQTTKQLGWELQMQSKWTNPNWKQICSAEGALSAVCNVQESVIILMIFIHCHHQSSCGG